MIAAGEVSATQVFVQLDLLVVYESCTREGGGGPQRGVGCSTIKKYYGGWWWRTATRSGLFHYKKYYLVGQVGKWDGWMVGGRHAEWVVPL